MKKRLIILFLFSFLTVHFCTAQNIDSLELALKQATNDTVRANILSQLTENCEIEDIPKYANPLAKLCEEKANLNLNKHLKFFYTTHYANALDNLGIAAERTGDLSKAINNTLKCIALLEEIKNFEALAFPFNNIAYYYYNLGDIPKALEYNHRSLKIHEQLNDKQGIATSLNNIAGIYDFQGEYAMALDYNNKSIKILKEINNKSGIAGALNNIAGIYANKKQITKALEYYYEALAIQEEIQDKATMAYTLNNIGFNLQNQGDIKQALSYYLKSLKLNEELNNKRGITFSLNDIAGIFLTEGKYTEALDHAKQSLKMAKELGYPESIRDAAVTLRNIYKKTGNYKDALQMLALEVQMRDSVNNEQTKKISVKKAFQYQYEKKAAADSVKNAEQQIVKDAQLTAQHAQLKQERTQRFALYGGLLLVIAFLGFVLNRFKVTRKQKKIIEEQKVLVDQAYETLHEKNKEVMDSINYASRIQRALITSDKYISTQFRRLMKDN